MQFIESSACALGSVHGEAARLLPNRAVGGETLRRQWICVFLLVFLLHVVLIAYLNRWPEQETPEPSVMEVALIAAPAEQPVKPAAPLASPVVKPKPPFAPVKPKKAPALPKKTPVIPKSVAIPTPAPESAPAAKTTASSAPAQISPAPPVSVPQSPTATSSVNIKPKTETFTEASYQANYKSNPKPDYPRLAKSRSWQGKVLLRVQVTADGHSAGISVQQSSGHEMLDDAAIEAVKNWTFIPAKRGDTPVASTVTVPIQFKLSE